MRNSILAAVLTVAGLFGTASPASAQNRLYVNPPWEPPVVYNTTTPYFTQNVAPSLSGPVYGNWYTTTPYLYSPTEGYQRGTSFLYYSPTPSQWQPYYHQRYQHAPIR